MTVGINVLKLCFNSEFEISRGADFEHFRKVSRPVTLPDPVLVTLLHTMEADTGFLTLLVQPDMHQERLGRWV